MGKLLIAAALLIGGYLVHTGHIKIGDRGFRASASGGGGYSSAPGSVAGGVIGAAAKIGN
ncbi:MAG: hypothetical protein NWQ37_03935 [Marivita lacus]|jgi:hypothetical protein|nr:hypothetical protein [Marivita lacus]